MFAAGSFADLGVSAASVAALARRRIVTPTNAQAAVIPLVADGLAQQLAYAAQIKAFDDAEAAREAAVVARALGGREAAAEGEGEGEGEGEAVADVPTPPPPPEGDVNDVLMIGAETGSGKTLAYLLPYVEAVRSAPIDLKAVVLVPSRELCWQIARFLGLYFDEPPPHLVLAGGTPPDLDDVKGVKIVIATPTALLNYFRFSPKPDASDKYIVVDEADMLLSGGFLADVERILNQPGMKPFATRKNKALRESNRNRLLFIGATYPHWTGEKVRSIITWMRRRYPGVKAVQTDDIHRRSDRLRSRWHFLNTEEERVDALVQVLRDAGEHEKVMVFGSKAETMARVSKQIESRLGDELAKFGGALQLHKLVQSKDRVATLDRFRTGEARLLFCTDLASRGLDLGDVTRVVEFEFSHNVVGYLHRIGRTARAGAAGASDHFYDEVSRPLADAIRSRAEDGTTVVEGVFSRKRSFRRKLKKRLAAEGPVRSLEDVHIDEIDAQEEARLRGE